RVPVVLCHEVASLASRRSDALRSSFRPTYNMAANLVRRYTTFEAHHLLNLSFPQFHADRDVVARAPPAVAAVPCPPRRRRPRTSTRTVAGAAGAPARVPR